MCCRSCLFAADGRDVVFFNLHPVTGSSDTPRRVYKSLCRGSDSSIYGIENEEKAQVVREEVFFEHELSTVSEIQSTVSEIQKPRVEKPIGSLHTPSLHNSLDDGKYEHNDFGLPLIREAEECFEQSTFNHSVDTFVERYDGKYVTPDDSIPLQEDDVPYIFAVITLTTCPDWFKKNMLHAKKVQAKGTKALPVERAHPVVLVEGHEPACRDW